MRCVLVLRRAWLHIAVLASGFAEEGINLETDFTTAANHGKSHLDGHAAPPSPQGTLMRGENSPFTRLMRQQQQRQHREQLADSAAVVQPHDVHHAFSATSGHQGCSSWSQFVGGLASLHATASTHSAPILVAYLTRGFEHFFSSTLCQLGRQRNQWSMVVVVQDDDLGKAVSSMSTLPSNVALYVTSVPDSRMHMREVRIRLAHAAVVCARMPILMLDLDLAILGDFSNTLSHNTDVQVMQEDVGSMNTGFVVWQPTVASAAFLEKLVSSLDERMFERTSFDEQDLLEGFLCCLHEKHLIRALNGEDIACDPYDGLSTTSFDQFSNQCHTLTAGVALSSKSPLRLSFFSWDQFFVDQWLVLDPIGLEVKGGNALKYDIVRMNDIRDDRVLILHLLAAKHNEQLLRTIAQHSRNSCLQTLTRFLSTNSNTSSLSWPVW